MKKLILTTIVYDMPGQTEPVTRQKLVVINSSKAADENHDTAAAVHGCKAWFEKSVMTYQGATYISITAEPTIDAENPEPPTLYTEADLVSFGNYMTNKVYQLIDTEAHPETAVRVGDWDLANWRESKDKS